MIRTTILILLTLIKKKKKESIFDEHGFYGDGIALLNGIEWKGKTGIFSRIDPDFRNCLPDTCIGISIIKRSEEGFLRNEISISSLLLAKGRTLFDTGYVNSKYDTITRISYGEYTGDGELVSSSYSLVKPDSNNYIEIIELNRQTWDIKGIFRARVVKSPILVPTGGIPDTIDIEEGSFYGRVKWNK